MTRRVAFFSFLAILVFGGGRVADAVFYDVSIVAGDVSFSPPELILATPTRIYATVSNDGERDVEGVVRFYDNDVLIGTKLFSVRANVRPEDTWVRWTPQGYGAHNIRIVVDNDDAFPDATPGNNTVTTAVFIDRDTDGDGVPDQQDDDRDNDTILNSDEVKRGTDPLKRDTDGDGVDDPKDVFPLDARRSVLPPPTPTSTAKVKPTTPVSPKAITQPIPVRSRTTPTIETPVEPTSETAPVLALSAQDASPSNTVSVQAGEANNEVTSTGTAGVPEPEPTALAEESIASRPNESSSSLGSVLVFAAILSALAAGAFIWLGIRRR